MAPSGTQPPMSGSAIGETVRSALPGGHGASDADALGEFPATRSPPAQALMAAIVTQIAIGRTTFAFITRSIGSPPSHPSLG
jgi:hypothetical protein